MTILEEIKNCPVEWKELGEVALLKRGKTITSKTSTDGPYPVISGGQKPAYFHGEFNREGETITVAGSGAYAGFVMYWDEPIFVSDAFSIEPLEDALIPKFLYHYLLEKQGILFSMKKGSGVAHVYPKDVSKILIPIPPLEIQEKIVQKLDKMTEYVTELTSELTSRKKQYSFYRDKLLSFEDELYQVEWKMLGEVCEIIRGNGLQKKDFVDEGVPCIHYGQIYTYYSSYVYKTKSFISFSLSEKLKKAQTGDIIVATTSENIEDVGKSVIWLGDGEICIGGHSCIMKTKENSKYINYCMRSIFFQKQKEKQAVGTKVIELYPKNLSKIKIPIPPLEIQEKIVQILDKFDTVCNDLNIGLPKEVELRQKQYEYWRNQLLNFNK